MVQKPLMTQGYSLAEEIANSISPRHWIGILALSALLLLLVQAVEANAGMTAIASYSF